MSLRCGGTRASKQMPFPHREDLDSPEELYALTETLFGMISERSYPIYFVGLSLNGLEKVVGRSISRFFKTATAKEEASDPSSDSAGPSKVPEPASESDPVVRAVVVPAVEPVVQPEPALLTAATHPGDTGSAEPSIKEILDLVDELGSPMYFKCGECGEILAQAVKQEHVDHHFAMSLSRQLAGSALPTAGASRVSKKSKKPAEAKGPRTKFVTPRSLQSFFKK
ncbi:hypothetical protein HDU91_002460 [Kappamyces sp. JEL0680]|nr:hypothetical protein HDU91_002460 [Kappamyces sp. JEL0680]